MSFKHRTGLSRIIAISSRGSQLRQRYGIVIVVAAFMMLVVIAVGSLIWHQWSTLNYLSSDLSLLAEKVKENQQRSLNDVEQGELDAGREALRVKGTSITAILTSLVRDPLAVDRVVALDYYCKQSCKDDPDIILAYVTYSDGELASTFSGVEDRFIAEQISGEQDPHLADVLRILTPLEGLMRVQKDVIYDGEHLGKAVTIMVDSSTQRSAGNFDRFKTETTLLFATANRLFATRASQASARGFTVGLIVTSGISVVIFLVLQFCIDLVKTREAAAAASRAKSQFLANMSHEIRTPMTAILGFTDMLHDSVVAQEDIDAVHTIKENGNYLIHIINDILDLSKIEAEKTELKQTSCVSHTIAADVASLMRVRSEAKGLELDVQFDGKIPETIHSDPTRLRQILINLVGNAIKFTESGSVKLVTRLLNERGKECRLQFDVVDTGIGIAEDDIEKLFRAFTQADNSMTRQFSGTGLGLTISERLVKLLGGDISVSSVPGKGSTFSITIPTGPLDGVRLIDNDVEQSPGNVKTENAGEAQSSLYGLHILYVEDGPDIQRLVSFLLKKAGATVTLAQNGKVGFHLAMAAKRDGCPFDVILMDMQMPVMDGYEATLKLRENDYTLPIIAITAHAMANDRQRCLDIGCDDYVTKPVSRKTLIKLLANYATCTEVRADTALASSGV